jgi:hypothetical protein
VAQEGRLGEDLDVQERRGRLEGDRRQLLPPMEPAGRVDVEQGDGEDQPPRQSEKPAFPPLTASGRPTAEDMVAVVDDFEQRFQVGRGPGLLSGGHQDQGIARSRQAAGERDAEVRPLDRDDPALDRPPHRRERIDERRDDRLGTLDGQVGQQDDSNPGVRKPVAMEVAEVGVVDRGGGGHSLS